MKTRQAIGTHHTVAVRYNGQIIAVRFRPDQRKLAKVKLIAGCFWLGYVIELNHRAFSEIDLHTWSE